MNIVLYTNSSENNAVNKNLTELATLTGSLREGSSIINPQFSVAGLVDYIADLNYAYIPAFNRYYFVTGVEAVRENLWHLTLRVDVLYTYKDQILENSAIIERNENEYDLKLNDGLFKTQQNPRIAQFPFPSGFNTWNFVIAIAGN